MGRIIGDKITLREYRREDLSALRAWVNDGETTKYLSGAYRRPQTWEQTEEWLDRRLKGDAGGEAFVISENGASNYVGQCDLMMIDAIARKAELAIVLTKESRGKGIAKEAIQLLLKYAFDALNLNRVWLKCASRNTAAVRCYESAGFKTEGVLKDDLYIDGEYSDALIMAVLRKDFTQS